MAVVTNADTCLRWLAKDPPDLDETREAAERIVSAGHRAADIIRTIRTLARKSATEVTRFDVNSAISDVLAPTSGELRRYDVLLETQLSAGLEPVSGDRGQIQQVILNLTVNAIEAMTAGRHSPRVLRVSSQMAGRNNVLIAVADTGTGLDPTTVDGIFDAFFTTKPDGMGMGLSICRSIVEAHGGRLWASSNSPRGSIFQFTVPAAASEALNASESRNASDPSMTVPDDECESTVAVIDDDPDIREALRGLLRSVGLRAELFASVQEFLGTVRPDRPGCLILDVRLPGRSGLDLQEQLAQANIRRPVIFISGHADVPMSVRAMKAGAVEFLTKPVRDQDLLDAIQVAITKDRARRDEERTLARLRADFDTLTPRERAVMMLVVAGRLNKQIAAELGLSEATVKVHRGHAMRKMHVQSVAELVRIADKLVSSQARS